MVQVRPSADWLVTVAWYQGFWVKGYMKVPLVAVMLLQ